MMQTVFTSVFFTLPRYRRPAVENTKSDTRVRLDSKGIKDEAIIKKCKFSWSILDRLPPHCAWRLMSGEDETVVCRTDELYIPCPYHIANKELSYSCISPFSILSILKVPCASFLLQDTGVYIINRRKFTEQMPSYKKQWLSNNQWTVKSMPLFTT